MPRAPGRAWLCWLGAAATGALVLTLEGSVRPESVVLPTLRCGDLFIVQALIDGAGPFAMLLDTGASISVISPRVAAAVGVDSRYGSVERIDIGELHLEGSMGCLQLDIDHLSGALGREIDGILGHRVFRGVLLTYDYPAGRVSARVGALADDAPGVAPMSRSARPFVGAMLGERKINVLLDTGSTAGLVLSGFDELPLVAPPRPVSGTMRIDGLHVVRAGRLSEDVRFGSFTLRQPVVRNAVGDSLLGQAILRDFVVTVDQRRGRVQIVRPGGRAVEEPLEAPGLHGPGWLLRLETDRAVVQEVFAGSAAESAGFRKDDVVLAIDGVPLRDIGCSRHERTGDHPTRKTFLLERDGERLELGLTTGLLVP
jgi:hypothetical protein